MNIVFLGRLADAAGERTRSVDLPRGIDDVDALRSWLGAEVAALLDPSVRMIVNDTLATRGQPLAPDDEVAFFPPVSGG